MPKIYNMQDTNLYDFTALPAASSLNQGLTARCNPLVAGQPFFTVRSDGSNWLPHGPQTLYTLPAPIVGIDTPAMQKYVEIPVPPKMLSSTASQFEVIFGTYNLGVGGDTYVVALRFGVTGTSSDTALVSKNQAAGVYNLGATQRFYRYTSNSLGRAGVESIYSNAPLSSTSSNTTSVPLSCGDMDTLINYLTLNITLGTSGLGDTIRLNHLFVVWLS